MSLCPLKLKPPSHPLHASYKIVQYLLALVVLCTGSRRESYCCLYVINNKIKCVSEINNYKNLLLEPPSAGPLEPLSAWLGLCYLAPSCLGQLAGLSLWTLSPQLIGLSFIIHPLEPPSSHPFQLLLAPPLKPLPLSYGLNQLSSLA